VRRFSVLTSEHALGRATKHENVGTNADVAGLKARSTRTQQLGDGFRGSLLFLRQPLGEIVVGAQNLTG
jgi:hypothetical protein